MHRFFQVPELLSSTFELLFAKDVLCVLRVSRLFFSSAAPLIWKDLYRASDILLLISGARPISIVEYSVEIIELPHSLKKSHFARFNIYAPFVKTLVIDHKTELSPHPKHHYETPTRLDSILNWQVLIDYLGGEALLPYLTRVTFRYPDYQACLNWLSVLLLPSIHGIHAIIMDPEWPMEVVCAMLRLAASKSADLGDLFISPRGFDSGSIEEDVDPDSLSQRQLELLSSFAPFHKLCCLRSNIAVLYPQSLIILSELPYLEELMVGVGAAPLLSYDISLRETAFPSFRKLILENVMNPYWIMNLWSVQALFKNLATISISMWPGVHEPEHGEQWADNFLSRICSHSPNLSDLSILFNGGDNDQTPFLLSQDIQEPFRLLPLKSLMISDAYFDGGCAFLSSAWPGIAELSCDCQSASLADLVGFARNLPNLEKLQLNVELGGSSIPEFDLLSPLSPRYTTFRRLSSDSPRQFKRSSTQTKKLAEYLHLLWPNIQCSRSFWDHAGADTLHRSFMNHNERRGLDELKVLDSWIGKLRINGH